MYSSSSFFVQTRLRTRSSSFLVQVAPQRVPGHPEAKSCQNLIRNGLLEAILEASRPASKPARQAQPLGRVFSTKRARGQDRRVFSSRLVPKGSLDVRRPTYGRKNSSTQTGFHRKNSKQKIKLFYFPQRISKCNIKNSLGCIQGRDFSTKKSFNRKNSLGCIQARVFSPKRARGQDRRVFRMGPRRPNWTESL